MGMLCCGTALCYSVGKMVQTILCRMVHAYGAGIRMELVGCSFHENKGHGISAVDYAEVQVRGCTSRGHGVAGYYANNCGHMEVQSSSSDADNTARGVGLQGTVDVKELTVDRVLQPDTNMEKLMLVCISWYRHCIESTVCIPWHWNLIFATKFTKLPDMQDNLGAACVAPGFMCYASTWLCFASM